MTDAGRPPYPAPLPNDPGPPAAHGPGFAAPPRRRPMLWRHLLGPLVALTATPLGLVLVDYGAGQYLLDVYRALEPGWSADLLWLVAGGLVLTVAALSARISGLGPVLAALVWGVVPFVWYVSEPGAFYRFARDLPSTHPWFSSAPVELPLLGALLLGAGIAGRWRGREVPS
ncbi:hypothetical protein G5V59_15860 [Nocardioides sp. W3-2-3]|uniref:hypothetical protein n=1 Tax=Nocardioides convexus TaxID=2712224 RepID=UPI0024183B72|nr:hypothetical protein [Nocardioides convexus]NHA00898.1 hypothetical protein [Nocardioides convexus]